VRGLWFSGTFSARVLDLDCCLTLFEWIGWEDPVEELFEKASEVGTGAKRIEVGVEASVDGVAPTGPDRRSEARYGGIGQGLFARFVELGLRTEG
jgi:hypothetical protein